MKYLGATHKFEKDGKIYVVDLRDGTATINGMARYEWKDSFNTTKTRALQALKRFLHEEDAARMRRIGRGL